MISFLILFALILLTAYITNLLLSQSIFGFRWRIFVAPGVIIHELSHALACLLTGAKIVKISFFDKDGGSVTHKKPLVPLLGTVLISIAPLIIGILIFYFLAKEIKLSDSLDFSAMYFNLKSILRTIDFSSTRNWVIIYLLVSTVVTMTPSKQDLMNMAFPLVILAAIAFLVIKFTTVDLAQVNYLLYKILPMLNMVVFVLLVCLLISFVVYLLTKLILRR